MKISPLEVVKGTSGNPPTVSLEASLFYMGTISLSKTRPTLLLAANTPSLERAALLSGKKASLAGTDRIGAIGVEGGLIIVSWGTYPDNVCKMATGADGKAKATSLPYPAASKSMTYKATFCPYTKDNNDATKQSSVWMANCAQLKDDNGNAITPLNWKNIPDCAGAGNVEDNVYVGGQGEDCGEQYLPSSDFASITNSTPSNENAGFCWVLAFLFGLLASAAYTMGRNPFQFLNPGIGRSVKMNRNAAYYRPMHQSVSIDPTAYLSAADRIANTVSEAASDSDSDDTKEAKAEVKSAKAEVAAAKTPRGKGIAQQKLNKAEAKLEKAQSAQPSFNQRMQGASQKGLVSGKIQEWIGDLGDWAGEGALDLLGLNDEDVDKAKEKLDSAGEKYNEAREKYISNPNSANKKELDNAGTALENAQKELGKAVENAKEKQGFWGRAGTSVAKSAVSQGIRGVLLTPMAMLGGGKSFVSTLGYAAKNAGVGVLRDTTKGVAREGAQAAAQWAASGSAEEMQKLASEGKIGKRQYEAALNEIGKDLYKNTVEVLKNSGVADTEDKVKLVKTDDGRVLVTYTDNEGTRVVAGTTNNADKPFEVFHVGYDSSGVFAKGDIGTIENYLSPTESEISGSSNGGIKVSARELPALSSNLLYEKKSAKAVEGALKGAGILSADNNSKLNEKIKEMEQVDKVADDYYAKTGALNLIVSRIFDRELARFDPFSLLEPDQYSLRTMGGSRAVTKGIKELGITATMSEGAWDALGTASLQYLLNQSASNNQFMLSVINLLASQQRMQ
ncbi:hypothetical protein COU37_04335 [Candidatus Micrarchaeota archaeon CG10_big_fil_rev_8_21_14_0_10_45_29]|nr:MAG: hypothetical protein COU37_04335 [Candidatus Micrarchaeota archaeon CG10_big_fil_rev_8_21_14_0_10_45_29]